MTFLDQMERYEDMPSYNQVKKYKILINMTIQPVDQYGTEVAAATAISTEKVLDATSLTAIGSILEYIDAVPTK